MEIHPLTPGRLEDLADLFKTSTATRGCWCMWFINPAKDVQAGWGDGRIRLVFEALAQTADPPLGLLAYEGDRPGRMAGNRTEARYPHADCGLWASPSRHRDGSSCVSICGELGGC